MKIAILILMAYSVCGIHISFPLFRIKNVVWSICSDKICIVIALVLYCIMIFN